MPTVTSRHTPRTTRDARHATLGGMPRPNRSESLLPQAGAHKVATRLADRAVAAKAAEVKGILTLDELSACGLGRDAVSLRTRRGWLHLVHRGVYVVGHAALTPEQVWLAAVKACGPTAVLSHYSAAAHRGYVEWDGRRPEVTVTTAAAPRHPSIKVHQSRCLDRRDVMPREGMRVTAPARTLLDLASALPQQALRRAVREAMARQDVGVRQLAEVLARTGPRRGSRKLAAVIADGYTPTRSVLEDIVLDLIVAGGFERPDVNKPLVLGGRRLIPDFRWSSEHLIVEADGATWHDNKVAREDDADRQAHLEAHGEQVLRITWDDAARRQHQTWARLAAAGAPRGEPGGGFRASGRVPGGHG
jgi:predicted transcriptional regulator of viral defense system